ncbi:MAG: hypothetical protein JOY71_23160 [Acetobacteraceae bacterium]|nr:hypothetical protein [Acetobacteraceae bacterium]MBV8524982.1 hypothetical protein [Acetobacteraceae bacterium]MBV8589161.1 hypothetical protein [Acetobacteraceae bacterium]
MTSRYENLCLFKLGWPCDFDHQERGLPVKLSAVACGQGWVRNMTEAPPVQESPSALDRNRLH